MTIRKYSDYLPWILALVISIIFIQSLFFKFSNSFETQVIFSTIGQWMSGIKFLSAISASFTSYGAYVIGTIELIASILMLRKRTQFVGAFIALSVISGAIFFHLFTPLGVSVIITEAGERDGGQLFAAALAVFIMSLGLMWLRREQLLTALAKRKF